MRFKSLTPADVMASRDQVCATGVQSVRGTAADKLRILSHVLVGRT